MNSPMNAPKTRIWVMTLAMFGILAGCERAKDPTLKGAYESTRAYLSLGGSDIDRALGMESPTTDWHLLGNAPGYPFSPVENNGMA